ncbi:MAG: PadR family transcriptional regulator [Propionibacteriaceae bacterium]|nr:PadR family transcriptional regulator [Propionibacteriaceae bacterium]
MVPSDDIILANLRRGTLEYCILALLARESLYGLDIARRLTPDGLLMGSEGTLYPLLTRLRKAGWVETRWQESNAGPPRRYYAITGSGRAALAEFTATWQRFSAAVDATLEGNQ